MTINSWSFSNYIMRLAGAWADPPPPSNAGRMYAVQLGVKKFGRDKSLQKDLMGLLDLVDGVG